ncbi:MAG: hypothetical protein U5N10_04650 [Gemmobacter sp.]|nr:hypothetical protein [Gemmobacter sp.]
MPGEVGTPRRGEATDHARHEQRQAITRLPSGLGNRAITIDGLDRPRMAQLFHIVAHGNAR